MHTIWAPWRNEYITLGNPKRCIFCIGKKNTARDRKNYVLKRGKYAFSILNRYPYNNGHVMVAPYRHLRSPELLSENEMLDLFRLINETRKRIDRFLKPDGYNIGLNLGKVAGAGFAGHMHVHIVPRWQGDTNFMPVISNTKVVSGSLDELWKVMKC
jgi:ATP adenylyltransferase